MRFLSSLTPGRLATLQVRANRTRSLLCGDDGAQVVEYALIIAVVSIALAVALGDSASGLGTGFADLAARVVSCFAAGSTCT